MWLVILSAFLLGGCFGKKAAAPVAGTSAEPDKVLYAKATDDIKHGRYTIGRLALQTLINTYPDSEYLAKAKLAIADSYYKEGGTAGLKQSIVEYKDFITFFPFLDEAALRANANRHGALPPDGKAGPRPRGSRAGRSRISNVPREISQQPAAPPG